MIGIDLGMTKSCVAVWQNDHVEIIVDDQGKRLMPSYVAFTETERLIGDDAKNQVAMNPNNTIYDMKRLIGRRFGDPSVCKGMNDWPFKVISGPLGRPLIKITYKKQERHFVAEEIPSIVLARMKEIAEGYTGKSISDAVVSVPSFF